MKKEKKIKLEFHPYCTSFKCNGNKMNEGKRKVLSSKPIECPDCGYALFYKKIEKVVYV